MSHDISIGNEDFDHTWNTHKLLKEIFPGTDPLDGSKGLEPGLAGMNNMDGANAANYIEQALERLYRMYGDMGEEKLREEYNSPNGWGSVLSVTLLLSRLMAACTRHPFSKVEIS